MTLVTGFHQGPFQISASQVEALSEDDLVRLLNALILAEAWRIGLAAELVRTTLRTNHPDGGIDALVAGVQASTAHFPVGETVWQFKRRWGSPSSLRRDLERGEAAREAFARGAGYTMVLGDDRPASWQNARQATVQEITTEFGCTLPARVLAADTIAQWASSVPGVLLAIHPVLAGCRQGSLMLVHDPRHRDISFEPDEMRSATIDEIAARTLSTDASALCARIQGDPGVGKSRLALEAVRSVGLDSQTIYAEEPSNAREFLMWAANNPSVRGIVIADECENHEGATRIPHGAL